MNNYLKIKRLIFHSKSKTCDEKAVEQGVGRRGRCKYYDTEN